MVTAVKTIIFTWKDFQEAVEVIVNGLRKVDRERRGYSIEELGLSFKSFDGIYGIPRGGLVLAVCLSHRLDLPLRDSVNDRTIVVDDIADTGETLFPYRDNLIATIHWVEGSKVKPKVYALEKTRGEWVRYPWEV